MAAVGGYRWVDHDGERVLASVESTSVYRIVEGKFDERLHPRNRLGRWMDSLGDAIRGRRGTVLGTTPYHKDRDPGYPRTTHRAAKALHSDPAWRPLFDEFEQDAADLAKEHNVEIVRGERNVGVFEGEWEPSYALKVRGADQDVQAFNDALGRKHRQDAVVSFAPHPDGKDAEVHLEGGSDPDAFFKELVRLMGDEAGASFEENRWRVFVNEADGKLLRELLDVAERLHMGYEYRYGTGTYSALK